MWLGLTALKEFMLRECSIEILLAYLDILEYEKMPVSERQSSAYSIWCKYFREGAHLQINITTKTLNVVETRLEGTPNDLFASAKNEVIRLLEGDVLPRFTKSEEAKNYIALNALAEELRE